MYGGGWWEKGCYDNKNENVPTPKSHPSTQLRPINVEIH
jgi:hypothetical protein